MGSERFYADLPASRDFAAFADLSGYRPLPPDWTVLASDVTDSTRAIGEGRYKQVNMAGAATIMAALNAAGDLDAPYVFGGDGALVAVPHEVADAAIEALARTAGLVSVAFDLDLRTAAFPMKELNRRGAPVLVRKFALGEGARLAMFAGAGVAMADTLLKDPARGRPFRIPPSDETPDLEGLSCRWEPLKPAHGVMLTLMAAPQAEDDGATLATLRQRLQAVLGGDETVAAPVSDRSLSFRWPPRGLKLEALTQMRSRSFWKTYASLALEALAQGYAEKFGRKVGPYDAPAYRQEMRTQTDFRKFDGLLRMVLDVSPETADALEAALAAEHEAGRIVYGAHRADAALMTCLVFDLAAADHVHFIDGADGGFAMAAVQFKAQLAAARSA